MTRFKIEVKEKPKLTHKEEVRKMFDKRMDDVNQILRHHKNGLEPIEISWKVRFAESYIKDVIRDGYEKTKIQLLKQYRLNEGGEKMQKCDTCGHYHKNKTDVEKCREKNIKTEQAEPVTSREELQANIVESQEITSEKKTITEHIREIAKEIGAFKPVDMVEAFAKKGLSYKKSAIVAHIGALNVDASESVKKYQASIYKHAFLKKDTDGKYTIV